MKEAGYDPQAAVELQELFVKLSEGRETSFIQGMFATHPPSRKRVRENQELVDKIGAGGYRGREEYQKKTEYLRSLQPAYDAHDEAMKLASDDKLDQALAKVNEAISIEPDEAAFYSLRGRIYKAQGNEKKAEAEFDKATSLYPEMFTYQLHSGLNALELNKLDKAKERLNKANETVPTSIAYLRLGDIAVKQSRRDDAIQYYSTAAKAEGKIAQEAKQKLAQLTEN